MIDVYDNILEKHDAVTIDYEIKKLKWSYDYQYTTKKLNKQWYVMCGKNDEDCRQSNYPWAPEIFNIIINKPDIKNKYNIERYFSLYCIAYTYGTEQQIHTDDGDLTMLYYPTLDWKLDWGGGTAIYNEITNDYINHGKYMQLDKDNNADIDKYVAYKGNRLVIFDAFLPHQGQPISKQCHELRTVVVFKCMVEGGNLERLDYYK